MIQFINENIPFPEIHKLKVKSWIKETAKRYGKKTGEIAFIFCNDEKILEINRQYLQHDYYTDIITFDYSENNTISGDIFISLETVNSNATEFGVPYDTELLRIIIHGILHLCGQEDKTPA
ncbi:MAG: rRNA maturation RNase YbeY, partial [Paludibacter sp.]|nr:rRNA maturation RNase YbeY [Paludibacter sp.]